MRKWLTIGLWVLLGASGCESTLETGYKPAPLDASDSQRRAFYAPAYSPDARAARDDPAKGSSYKPNSQSY